MENEILFRIVFSLTIFAIALTQAATPGGACTGTAIDSLSCDFNDKNQRLCNYVNLRMDDGGLEWQGKEDSARVIDSIAPGGSHARIRAPVPKHVTSVCIDFMYRSSMRDPKITVYNEREDGSGEKVIGQGRAPSSQAAASMWESTRFHACVAKDSYISFEVARTEAHEPMIQIDNIKVTTSEMDCPPPPVIPVTKCGTVLKALSCVFDTEFCRFSNTPVFGSNSWVIKDGVAVFGDPMASSGASAELKALVRNVKVTSPVCLEFSYRSDDNALITITNKRSFDSMNRRIAQIGENTNGEWKVARFDACLEANSFISIKGEMRSANSIVSLKYFKVRESTIDCSNKDTDIENAVIG